MYRRAELDWLRGLMLVLMTLTHLPTWFSAELGQPFGYVSAAEGFVFISGFLVGCVYTRMAREHGFALVRRRLWRRTAQIYAAHVGILLFLLWVLLPVAVSKGAHPVTDLASFYLAHPHQALTYGLMLVYNPPLLDILPMYVLFLALSPLLLQSGARRGWLPVVAASAGLWLLSQFDVGRIVYASAASALALPIPYDQTGAFAFFAWQALWVGGLWAGSRSIDANPVPLAGSKSTIAIAAVVALVFFCWRHWAGQTPFAAASLGAHVLDKWHLGALRVVDFAALLVLVVAARQVIAQWALRSPLATLGKVSLTVFCAHVVICLAALASVADVAPARLHWRDSALLAATLLTLYVIARLSVEGKRIAPLFAAISARRAARTAR